MDVLTLPTGLYQIRTLTIARPLAGEAWLVEIRPICPDCQTPIVLADKGYDADAFLTWLANNDIRAVIPPKINRKEPRDCDFVLYKERHVVECTFGKLKHYRRIATRYEKTACHYMEMLSFAAALLWLR